MHPTRFDRLAKTTAAMVSRRAAFGALAGITGLLATGNATTAKKKGSKKKKGAGNKILCLRDGRHCRRKSERCKRQLCLKTPFTFEARWESDKQDHDSILFVPKDDPGNTVAFPYIDYSCLASETNNGTLYPFAFFSGDVQAGPGAETGTIQQWLAGTYELWVRVHGPAEAGDVTVRLRNADGKLIRTWFSPPNPPGGNTLLSWHVFDLDGITHSVTSIDAALDDDGDFDGIHPDPTFICPASERSLLTRPHGRARGKDAIGRAVTQPA
jgi:hypothetical protein